MSVHNINSFIALLKKHNQLKTINYELDPILEISEVTDRICKQKGPALLFNKVKNSKIPVAMNLFGSEKRVSLALGVENIDVLSKEISEIINIKPPKNIIDGIKLFPKYGKLFTYHTKTVKNAPCQEEIYLESDINLLNLPVLKCWPDDGGKYITLPIVITKDPENNMLNAGMYRMQVYDKTSTGMHWHKHHDGARHFRKYKKLNKKMEIAVAIGGPPSLIFGSTAPLPPFLDEFTFSCFLMKDSIKMVQCKTIDMKVPAESEIVLEGYIDPEENFKLEGPFGDHTGFYSSADMFPIFHINAITMKKNAIYPSIIVGKPPMEDTYMGKVTERIFLPMIKLFIPEVVDMNFPAFGVFHNFVFVSIKKEYPFQAKKVMTAIWSIGQLMLTKYIIVVDADVNVQNQEEVLWKMSNNTDPKRDVLVIDGPLDQLDHSSPFSLGGSKMGFDATTRFKEEMPMREYPKVIKMSKNVSDKIDRIWDKIFE